MSHFPLLIIFIFPSIHISTLLFLDDGIMTWKSSRFKKTSDLQAFPLSRFSFLYREAREVVSKYFVILHLSAKPGVKKINTSYFILRPLKGCLAADESFCTSRYLTISVILTEADIERLLLLLQMTAGLAQNRGRMFVCSTCRCKRV